MSIFGKLLGMRGVGGDYVRGTTIWHSASTKRITYKERIQASKIT